ncbi:MAG: COPII coat Sec23p-Sfb3p heterodimer component, partial [Chaenotheca gracillima]
MTYDLFQYESRQTGTLLGFIGFVAFLLQGFVTRRIHPLRAVQAGVLSLCLSFFLLGRVNSEKMLYVGAALMAVTNATVVTGLTSLASFEAGVGERGGKLGNHRSWGQVGRALGPLTFCSLYWWAGRETTYQVGGLGMLG